jgi:hypothetical protein
MKKRHQLLAIAFLAMLFILEACHRGSGCPGQDF